MSTGASVSLTTLPSPRVWTVALVGNPNTGKTTLFNALTGFRQHVANYPGVTVEKKSGRIRGTKGPSAIEVFDLPGAYSLTATAADEDVTLKVLLGYERSTPRPDAIICVVDACNLQRNLFLVSQILELGCPVVVALTMTDIASRHGDALDTAELSRALGVRVETVLAHRGEGVAELAEALEAALQEQATSHCLKFPDCICSALDHLAVPLSAGAAASSAACHHPCRAELLQTLLNPAGIIEGHLSRRCDARLLDAMRQHRARVEGEGVDLPTIEAEVRYHWIDEVVQRVVRRTAPARASASDRVDRVLTHPVAGLLAFLAMMGLVFQAIYAWATPLMDAIDGTFSALAGWVNGALPEGPLRSLLASGVIGGAGGVLVFLPQIFILFLFIALLEDCGYLARAAFVMDRHLRRLGLSGRSFIPLVSSFACAVPGIMASRVIEDRRDRLITVLIAPLMSCSARLPVYALMISAFVPQRAWLGGWIGVRALTLLGMYAVGMVTAIGVAWALKLTVGRGAAPVFLLELPNYSVPRVRAVVYRAYRAGQQFVVNAGTVILACSVLIWALGYYPRADATRRPFDDQRRQARTLLNEGSLDEEQFASHLARIDHLESGEFLRQSYLGRAGRWIEPAVRPLGWDWRIGTAAIASFPAREVVIATLGTIFNLGADEDETSSALRDELMAATWPDGRKLFNLPVALSLMVFFALCCQCVSTLAAIRRETNSWRWPAFAFTYMTALAYVGAMLAYQAATRMG